jgi:hypothetical protein
LSFFSALPYPVLSLFLLPSRHLLLSLLLSSLFLSPPPCGTGSSSLERHRHAAQHAGPAQAGRRRAGAWGRAGDGRSSGAAGGLQEPEASRRLGQAEAGAARAAVGAGVQQRPRRARGQADARGAEARAARPGVGLGASGGGRSGLSEPEAGRAARQREQAVARRGFGRSLVQCRGGARAGSGGARTDGERSMLAGWRPGARAADGALEHVKAEQGSVGRGRCVPRGRAGVRGWAGVCAKGPGAERHRRRWLGRSGGAQARMRSACGSRRCRWSRGAAAIWWR